MNKRFLLDDAKAEIELARKEAQRLRVRRGRRWLINRKKALARDNYACAMCGFRLCLEVHHIIPRAGGGSDNLDNLITLCPNHHALADRRRIPAEEFARALGRRTHAGRVAEGNELLGEIAKRLHATGFEPRALADEWEVLRREIPERLGAIWGVNANPDSFPPLPLGVCG